ncbi:unnamed protein product [Lathyrus sativus]|nr:unnamed protein product [Lathyrus sativus]
MWRLARNILPTRDNLSKKGITLDRSCPFYNSKVEIMHHVFLDCIFAKQTFFSSMLSLRTLSNIDICSWLKKYLASKDSLVCQLISATLYKIWLARNSVVFCAKTSSPLQVATKALDMVQEFNFWNENKKSKSSPNTKEFGSIGNVVIIQVDAGVFKDGLSAFGCLVKNHENKVLLSASKSERRLFEPTVAECLAIRWHI